MFQEMQDFSLALAVRLARLCKRRHGGNGNGAPERSRMPSSPAPTESP